MPTTAVPSTTTPGLRKSGPIVLRGSAPVVVENLHISNANGRCIDISGATSVIIRNSVIGPCGGDAIRFEQVSNATVTSNRIESTTNGIYALSSQSIAVVGNVFVNAGRNFVQFDKVTGSGNRIVGNSGENLLGGSNAEDMINLYKSHGTSASPIEVAGNRLRNGGPSATGSGIMAGDGGGSHQRIVGNVLVNPGQAGIGVASGTGIVVDSNRVFGHAKAWSNVGVYVWEQYGQPCNGIVVRNNEVSWTNSAGVANSWWHGGGCGSVGGVETNNWSAGLTPQIYG